MIEIPNVYSLSTAKIDPNRVTVMLGGERKPQAVGGPLNAALRISAHRQAIDATDQPAFLETWESWCRAKGSDDIPQGSALSIECFRPIVERYVWAVPQQNGAFGYELIGQGLRQLGWPEPLCGTEAIGNAELRALAQAHYWEAIDDRAPSLYEITVSRGNVAMAYQRLALPFGDCGAVRFLLLGISIDEASMRVLRVLTASH
jgi:hypothetical protein